jgi:hypothetical protein
MRPEETAVARAVRGLPDPEPRAAYRERLRSDFVRAAVRPAARRRTSPWKRWALGLLVPAAAVAALLIVAANRGPGWRILDPPAGTQLRIDGAEVDAADPSLARRLRAGARIELGEAEPVTLVSREQLVIQVLPGTEMTLSSPPARWFGRTVEASVDAGEVRIATDRGFRGARLLVTTPELDIEVLGTTLAVMRPPFGTCVCVHGGTVYVSPRGAWAHGGGQEPAGAPEAVPAGGRYTAYREEGVIDRGEILPEERMKLGILESLRAPAKGER